MLRRKLIGLVILALGITACQPAQYQGIAGATQAAPYKTPGPVTNSVQYWDLGLSIKYPDNWSAPLFLSERMNLAQSVQAAQGQSVTEPVVALSIRNIGQLGLTKDASLQDVVTALSAGPGVTFSKDRKS